ncbi:MAG TPA: hypothetical protein VJU87_09440 [Gemmatimonadaceae bacterium]|nr:hypothetical protein [Gemmatimonadaceae bacterium]
MSTGSTRLVRRGSVVRGALALGALAVAGPAVAQQSTASSAAPDVGQMAPDFAIRGATRYGVLEQPVRLSDFKGQTVVLAFFFQARTKG